MGELPTTVKPTTTKRERWLRWAQRLGLVVMFVAGLLVAQHQLAADVDKLALPTLSGEPLHIPPQSRDQLMWVNFWSMTCAPCLEELPYLDRLHAEFAGRASVVGVSAAYDPPSAVVGLQREMGLSLPLALDLDGSAAAQFEESMVVPSHYLVDGRGKILVSLKGALDEQTIRDQIRQHLK